MRGDDVGRWAGLLCCVFPSLLVIAVLAVVLM